MSTKARSLFLNRIAHYDADVELIDILSNAIEKGLLKSKDFLFDGVIPDRHKRLAQRVISDNGRTLAGNHLYNTLMSGLIKDLYEDFSIYLSEVVKACARKGVSPDRLIGKHMFEIDAKSLLALGSWNAVLNYISESLFRRLEDERSTIKLIKQLDGKLGLGLDAAIIDGAMPYLDLRHILVHRDGIADKEFEKAYPSFKSKADQKIHLSYHRIKDARTLILALVDHIDSKLTSGNLVGGADLHKSKKA